MAKKPLYVYSTLSADVRYCAHEQGGADVQVPRDGILIKGGAGVIDKRLLTPEGAIVTTIDADDLEQLRGDEVFKLHEANGYIKVSEHKEDGEKVAGQDMETRDASAQLTPQDYEPEKTPETGKVTPKGKA